jgi:hypothetical protein
MPHRIISTRKAGQLIWIKQRPALRLAAHRCRTTDQARFFNRFLLFQLPPHIAVLKRCVPEKITGYCTA